MTKLSARDLGASLGNPYCRVRHTHILMHQHARSHMTARTVSPTASSIPSSEDRQDLVIGKGSTG